MISQVVYKALQHDLEFTTSLSPQAGLLPCGPPSPRQAAGRVAAPCEGSLHGHPSFPASRGPMRVLLGSEDSSQRRAQNPGPSLPSRRAQCPRGPGPPHRWAAALLSKCLRAILGSLSHYLSTDGTVNHKRRIKMCSTGISLLRDFISGGERVQSANTCGQIWEQQLCESETRVPGQQQCLQGLRSPFKRRHPDFDP